VRRVGLALAGVVVAAAAVVGFLVVLSGRDAPGVPSPTSGPGRPAGAGSSPPAEGPERGARIVRDAARLSRAQLVSTLARGNVVVLFPGDRPPPALRALERSVAGEPFSPALADQGQAVVLGRYPGIDRVTALAWGHALSAASARDPRLSAFADYWLGAGAPG
jgi:Protein of unknown function (DUF3105)